MIIIYPDCKRCFKGCIHTQCPDYEPPKADHYCSICDEGIYPEEEYVVNDNNEYAHLECVDGGYEMATFLGYKIKIDEEDNWEDYYVDDRY